MQRLLDLEARAGGVSRLGRLLAETTSMDGPSSRQSDSDNESDGSNVENDEETEDG